jgi:hypothetical protein
MQFTPLLRSSRPHAIFRHWSGQVLAILLVIACGPKEEPSTEDPFIEDTDDMPVYNTSTSTTSFPIDTGFGSANDVEPDHWLHITQLGTWSLSPPGGPYANMTGGLTITEIVDQLDDTADPPDCLVVYTLVAQTYAPHSCAECDFALKVEFTGSGDRDNCYDPDMPPLSTPDGGGWPMGYSSSTNQVLFNYYGTGVWVPWYNATKVGDIITIDFTTSIAIDAEEDE